MCVCLEVTDKGCGEQEEVKQSIRNKKHKGGPKANKADSVPDKSSKSKGKRKSVSFA